LPYKTQLSSVQWCPRCYVGLYRRLFVSICSGNVPNCLKVCKVKTLALQCNSQFGTIVKHCTEYDQTNVEQCFIGKRPSQNPQTLRGLIYYSLTTKSYILKTF